MIQQIIDSFFQQRKGFEKISDQLSFSQSWKQLKEFFSIVTTSPPKPEQAFKKLSGLFKAGIGLKNSNKSDISRDKMNASHNVSISETNSQLDKSSHRIKTNANVTLPHKILAKVGHSTSTPLRLPALNSPKTTAVFN